MEIITKPEKRTPGYQLCKLTQADVLQACFRFAYGKDPTEPEVARSGIFQSQDAEGAWEIRLKVPDVSVEP